MSGRRCVRTLRGLLSGAFFVLYGLGSLLIGGVVFPPLALLRAHRAMRSLVRGSWRLFVWGARVTGLFRVEVSPGDRARLAAARGRVVVANHLTLIDIVVLMSLLPDATAVAKAAARGNFFYSLVVKGVFLVNDDSRNIRAKAGALLARGVDLVVFPQGTRVPANRPSPPLRRGAAQIALHAGAPLLPVKLTCEPPVLAKGQAWYDVGARTIVWTVRVGEEIRPPAPSSASAHAVAVVLTETIRRRLDLA